MKAIFGILTALLLTPALASAQDAASQPAAPSAQQAASTEWWREAKFGMFIHWGLYAEPARGEWVMNSERIPIAEYKKLAANFNPVKFNAAEWVAVAKAAGMKYITFSQKDGVFSVTLPKDAPDPVASVVCLEWASGN
jgi:alpha-L-fucosidase